MPVSGKDTWVATHAPTLPVVSFDDARSGLGLRHGQNDGRAPHFAVDKAHALLCRKEPFVWNATHLSEQTRGKTLDLLFAYDAHVRLVYLEAPSSVVFARNRQRDSTLSHAGKGSARCSRSRSRARRKACTRPLNSLAMAASRSSIEAMPTTRASSSTTIRRRI